MFIFHFQMYKCENIIAGSSFVIFDGNLSVKTIDTLVEICHRNKITSKLIQNEVRVFIFDYFRIYFETQFFRESNKQKINETFPIDKLTCLVIFVFCFQPGLNRQIGTLFPNPSLNHLAVWSISFRQICANCKFWRSI